MYAVINSGGKQYRVVEGQKLKLETIIADVGATIQFDKVLLVANGDDIKVGSPCLQNATVAASIVSHGRHKKVRIIKFRRRKHHMKQAGHRQNYTEVEITQIAG